MTAEPREDTKVAGERVAKVIARAGVASRRDAEALIADGRVKVNGEKLTTPAVVVGPSDEVRVDGEVIPQRLRTRAWLFHKPKGLVTTNRDPEGRRTIFDALPRGLPRVVTVGRLDINTEGLLILTNDGGLARVLELPATGWTRKYRVRVHGTVDEAALKALADGTAVDGTLYGPIHANLDRAGPENSWLTLALAEGKNREVKVVLGSLGLEVTRLIRVSFGPFQLADLPRGEVREVPTKQLQDQLGPRLAAQAGADFEAPIAGPVRRAKAVGSRAAASPAHSGGANRPASRGMGEGAPRRDRPRDKKEGRQGDKPQRSGARVRDERSSDTRVPPSGAPQRSQERRDRSRSSSHAASRSDGAGRPPSDRAQRAASAPASRRATSQGRPPHGATARRERLDDRADGAPAARPESARSRSDKGEAARLQKGPFRAKPRSERSAASPGRQPAGTGGPARGMPKGEGGEKGAPRRGKPCSAAARTGGGKPRSEGRRKGAPSDDTQRLRRTDRRPKTDGSAQGKRSRTGARPPGKGRTKD